MKTLEKTRGTLRIERKKRKKEIHINFEPSNFDILSKTWVFNENDTFLLNNIYFDMYIINEIEDFS